MPNPKLLTRRAPGRLLVLLCILVVGGLQAARAQFSQIIVFGDSLSDTGNDADVAQGDFGVRVPGYALGGAINYTDGRFTSGKDSDPASATFGGVWHEQLAKLFLGLPVSTASLDGGLNYAYGGATTEAGTRNLEFTNNLGITVDNMGLQVDHYLASHAVDPAALYIVWGGANDIFVSDRSADALLATGRAAAKRASKLVNRLAQAGAVNFLVPNLPPIGNTPRYNGSAGAITAYNAACSAFANKLAKKLDKVSADYTAAGTPINVYRLDVFNLFTRLLANQEAYNFYNIVDPSQGEGVKPDNYLFWDDVHPTAAGHYQLAVEAYTALTGRPLVQITPNFTASGFWLTRSGVNPPAKLKPSYEATGSAVAGVDYAALNGRKKIKPGQNTSAIATPALNGGGANGKTIFLSIADGGDAYGVGVLNVARIEYGNPIRSTNAVNDQPAASRARAAYPQLMLPGSGK